MTLLRKGPDGLPHLVLAVCFSATAEKGKAESKAIHILCTCDVGSWAMTFLPHAVQISKKHGLSGKYIKLSHLFMLLLQRS
jgi:hypothetical protein